MHAGKRYPGMKNMLRYCKLNEEVRDTLINDVTPFK
jgi:hypothetical protein